MSNFETAETKQRVPEIEPALVTRFRWRAERRARKLNAELRVPFYRFEVKRERVRLAANLYEVRWAVVAMQNVAVQL